MTFKQKITVLMILATTQLPCLTFAAEEDKDLALIAAEQKKSDEDEQLDDINPALNDSLSIKPTKETDKVKKERKKKLDQTRKEKEKVNEQKLKRSERRKDDTRRKDTVVIKDEEPSIKPQPPKVEPAPQHNQQPPKVEPTQPNIPPQSTVVPASQQNQQPPKVEPTQSSIPPQSTVVPVSNPVKPPTIAPQSTPSTISTVSMSADKVIYANFVEVAQAVHFTPLYMPRKSGYEITAIYASRGIVEVRYGRRWEPNVSLTIRTYKRKDGEELQDISGVTGVKWRVDTSTGTTIYIAKISETEQVAAWAVGHYTFSAQSENLSFASFHSIVADELIELSTHYYLDL